MLNCRWVSRNTERWRKMLIVIVVCDVCVSSKSNKEHGRKRKREVLLVNCQNREHRRRWGWDSSRGKKGGEWPEGDSFCLQEVTREEIGGARRESMAGGHTRALEEGWHGEGIEGPPATWNGRAAAFLWSGDDHSMIWIWIQNHAWQLERGRLQKGEVAGKGEGVAGKGAAKSNNETKVKLKEK